MEVRIMRLAASGIGVALALMLTGAASGGVVPDGGGGQPCSDAAHLPCAVRGTDSEAAVEAALADVLGPEVDVAGLHTGGGGIPNFELALDDASSVDWSYTGDVPNIAYLTFQSGDRFAVFGIAGMRGGRLDVAGVLGDVVISRVGVWVAKVSIGAPVVPTRLHGGPSDLLANARLSKIEDGAVPCVHAMTGEATKCRFTRTSGQWMESKNGWYAIAGQAITLDGARGGDYITAAEISVDGVVPCLSPIRDTVPLDSAGTPYDTEIGGVGCVIEAMQSPGNATGLPLVNHATREVCTTTSPHPDGAQSHRSYSSGGKTIFCYTGHGAALNDPNGRERDPSGVYYPESERCHATWSSGVEVPAAKRPATISYPYPGRVVPESPLVWRPVSDLAIAN
jgi:hypothetical protein